MYSLEEVIKNNRYMTYSFIEPIRADENGSEMKVVIREEHVNLSGYVHGGLLMTMADCAAGMAARGDGRLYVTQSAHMNFIRNRKEGTLYARAKVVNRGRTVVIVRVEIVDEKDCLLAEGTMDMFCVEKKS